MIVCLCVHNVKDGKRERERVSEKLFLFSPYHLGKSIKMVVTSTVKCRNSLQIRIRMGEQLILFSLLYYYYFAWFDHMSFDMIHSNQLYEFHFINVFLKKKIDHKIRLRSKICDSHKCMWRQLDCINFA